MILRLSLKIGDRLLLFMFSKLISIKRNLLETVYFFLFTIAVNCAFGNHALDL